MEGAAERMRVHRSHVWWGAMMAHMKKPPQFGEFVGDERRGGSEKVVCIKAWRELTDALRRGARRQGKS